MPFLTFLDFLAELIQLTFEMGVATRKNVLPALVWVYCIITVYVIPGVRYQYENVMSYLPWNS